jgi:hypothetical protein
MLGDEGHRCDCQAFVAVLFTARGVSVVADHPQHVVAVGLEAREGAELFGHLGRRGVGSTGHERRDRAADRPALVAVIGKAGSHQQTAQIGETEAEGPVVVAEARDLLGGELRHQHRDLKGDRPQPHRALERLYVERAVAAQERHQIERGEIAGRVVEEHVFRARVGRVDAAALGACVPLVDGGIELDARIGAGPGRIANAVPQIARLDRLGDLTIGAIGQVPIAVFLDRLEERVGDADGIVGVLTRHGEVGVVIPVGVVGAELD